MTGKLTIYTQDDLVKWAKNKPINELDEYHLKGGRNFAEADRVELHIDGWVAVLKDRYGPQIGPVPIKPEKTPS